MTIIDAIKRVDALRHNTFSQEEKVQWLSSVDGSIHANIMAKHENCPDFQPYTQDTPLDQVLLVGEPYEELYLYWLQAFMDFYGDEAGRFSQSVQMYMAALKDYEAWYNRTHRPLGQTFRYA